MKREIIKKAIELEDLLFNCTDDAFVDDIINRLSNGDYIGLDLLEEYSDNEDDEEDEDEWGYEEDKSFDEYNSDIYDEEDYK